MPHTPEHRTRPYVGVFEDRDAADRAARDLRAKGFKDDDFGYAWKDDKGVHKEGDTKAGEMATTGAVTGAALGGLAGAAAAGLIPGVGPIIAGGILAATLTGAAAGTAAGGLAGALVGMGIPDDEAKYYDEEFRTGRPILTLRESDRRDEASDIVRRGGGWDYDTRNEPRTRTTVKRTEIRS